MVLPLRPDRSGGAATSDLHGPAHGDRDAERAWRDDARLTELVRRSRPGGRPPCRPTGTRRFIAESLREHSRLVVLGRGYNLSTAFEITLKVKETSGVLAHGYSSADPLHAPLRSSWTASLPVWPSRPDGCSTTSTAWWHRARAGAPPDRDLDRPDASLRPRTSRCRCRRACPNGSRPGRRVAWPAVGAGVQPGERQPARRAPRLDQGHAQLQQGTASGAAPRRSTKEDPRGIADLAGAQWRLALRLTAAMMAVYFGFILLVAYDKPLARPASWRRGSRSGMLLGALVIVTRLGAHLDLRALGQRRTTTRRWRRSGEALMAARAGLAQPGRDRLLLRFRLDHARRSPTGRPAARGTAEHFYAAGRQRDRPAERPRARRRLHERRQLPRHRRPRCRSRASTASSTRSASWSAGRS